MKPEIFGNFTSRRMAQLQIENNITVVEIAAAHSPQPH
jgi:hypothetical protein